MADEDSETDNDGADSRTMAEGGGSGGAQGDTSNGGLDVAEKDADQDFGSEPAGGSVSTCGSSSFNRSSVSASPPTVVDPKKKHWIQIEMVDTEGKPVVGEDYKITLPDGTVVEGSLDVRGKARINGIDPGTCKITFPDLDKECWTAQ